MEPSLGRKQFFSCELSDAQRQLLGELSKKQIIFEAETVCAVLAHFMWVQSLECTKAFLYVDNEGTKFSLIRGTSENSTLDILAQIFAEHEAEHEVQTKVSCWISRVSSYSNIADAPSRGDTRQLVALGFEDVSMLATVFLEQIFAAMVEKLGKTAGCNSLSHS